MQAASLHTSIVLESSSFLVPLRDVTSEVEKSSRKMEQEQNRLARSADRLLSSLDPVYAAQSRFSKGMEEADRLLKAGAISVEQHGRAVQALRASLDNAVSAASRSVAAEQERLAASADRLLSSVDPLYAAQSRFNREMAEADRLLKAGAISAQQFATVEATLKGRLEQATAALKAHDMASAQSQQRMRLLGYQISDIGAQLVGGQSPFMVLAQQGPQVAMAFDGAKGAVGRFASFLTGPYGAAMMAATAAAGTLWMKMRESKNVTEEHERASKTLRETLDELAESTGRAAKSTAVQIDQDLAAAKANLENARSIREEIVAELERQQALVQAQKLWVSRSGIGPASDAAAIRLGELSRQEAEILERLSKQNQEMAKLDAALRISQADKALQSVTERMDAAAAATARYERASAALRKQFQSPGSRMSPEELARREEALRRARDAELEAIQEAARAADKAAKDQEKAARNWQKAVDSRIQDLLRERSAMEQYAKDMKILQEAMSSGVINAMERDLAGRRARQEWLDGLGLEKIEASIAKFDADKLIKNSLPTFDAKELQRLEGQRQITEELERSAERARQLDQAAMQFATNMSSSFEDAIFAGKGLRSVFSGLLEDMGKMVIRLTVIEPLARSVADSLKGGLGGGGGLFGLIGGLFGGARASGGPVTAGRTYLVGERGPELFVPNASGTIIPNGALQGMSGGGRTINITVNAQDAVLASTVKGWIVESMHAATAAGSADAQASIARRARRRIPGM